MSNKSIAVIGAGAAGLAATSYLLAEGFRVTLFEERSEPGGVWTRKDTTVHVNPIYDGLETNVPRTLMTFTDHPWRRSARMFPQDRTVKEYLKSYYEKINNSPEATANLNCQFDTTVLKLRRGRDRYQPAWKIESKSKAGESYLWSFDAVVVAGGNYSDPYTPVHEPGRQLWEGRRPGTILHSQQYQNPDKFRNKNVLVVGNSASGWDISGQVARVARRVVVSGRAHGRQVNTGCFSACMIAKYDVSTRTVRFACGNMMYNVDFVIYCTGYLYNFSFAVKGEEPLFVPGFKVANLYKHIFYTQEPSLAFVGLPKMTAAFTVAEAQSAVVARAFSGRLGIPTRAAMEQWEREFSSAHVQQMRADNSYHTLFQNNNEDKTYVNDLHAYATSESLRAGHSKPPPYWCRCLDNARAASRDIRLAYKTHSDESEGRRSRYTTYSSLGSHLDIPCTGDACLQHPEGDAVTCFLDPASI